MGMELTPENYLDLAYMGKPPANLTAEEKANIPDIIREQMEEDEPEGSEEPAEEPEETEPEIPKPEPKSEPVRPPARNVWSK